MLFASTSSLSSPAHDKLGRFAAATPAVKAGLVDVLVRVEHVSVQDLARVGEHRDVLLLRGRKAQLQQLVSHLGDLDPAMSEASRKEEVFTALENRVRSWQQ